MSARHRLDPAVRRTAAGTLLIGGVPARLLRLSAAGAKALDAILAGDPPDPPAAALVRRLRAAGTIVPLAPEHPPAAALTTVVPVRDGGPGLAGLVESLLPRGEVIVVDDRSGDGSPQLAAAAGARVIANAGSPGPAGARNTGLGAADTDLVAFLDADCEVESGWSDGLAALLAADPESALVGPRIRSAQGRSRLARYETRFSPLDLGPDSTLVGPGRRVSYLPSAALVGRRQVLLELGGFEEALRFGEDVDLVWRLLEAGHSVRYAAEVEVHHAPRPTLAALARQRAGYGGSAPELERRHPGRASPLRVGRHPAAVWAAGAALGPAAAGAALVASTAGAGARGTDGPSRRGLVEIALRGQLAAGRQLARALSREWLPLTALACSRSARARRLALAALLLDATLGGRSDGDRLDPASLLALRLVDNAAYAAGLWGAAARIGSAAALRPRLLSPSPLPAAPARR